MSKVEQMPVRLEAIQEIDLEPGVKLKRGSYDGVRELIKTDDADAPPPKPHYYLTFGSEELRSMGVDKRKNSVTTRYDVTKYIRLGQLMPF